MRIGGTSIPEPRETENSAAEFNTSDYFNSSFTLPAISTHQARTNWAGLERKDTNEPGPLASARTAIRAGKYDTAASLIQDGLHQPSTALRGAFHTLAAIHAWRVGNLVAAKQYAQRCHHSACARVVDYAVDFEQLGHPQLDGLPQAVRAAASENEEAGAFALGVQARVRAAWGEPNPARGLIDALHKYQQGADEILLALAEIDPSQAAQALREVGLHHWRGAAIRGYIEGLHLQDTDRITAAAGAFEDLGELLVAARAYHAAAKATNEPRIGNRLRERAQALCITIGADRLLATILRERRQRREAGSLRIPESQRFASNAGLTRRQREVAELIARGEAVRNIAHQLHLSDGTVRNVIAEIRGHYGGVRLVELRALLGE
ncbi:MAG: hypothetical protein HOQ05_13420 [Corynebacteriales bacterium]|nr:hypothetical protein [Mycobacteriales bacterium]